MGWYFSREDMGLDLGSANTVMCILGKGVILDEPSVVASKHTKGVFVPYAFGNDAKLMLGRTPSDIKAIRPLKDGIIADFKASEEMIKYFIRKGQQKRMSFRGPAVCVCVPYGSTPVERRAKQDAVESAGASDVFLIEEPMAAAIGAGLPVTEPTGSMVVDIGGGTTEVGLISLGGIVYARSVRVGGHNIDETISSYVRKEHGLLIGEATAERIKKEIGVACLEQNVVDIPKREMLVCGRDVQTGIPRELLLNSEQIMFSMMEPIHQIIEAVISVLETSPPELAADLKSRGIWLTGGGGQLHGLSDVIRNATGLPVFMAENPLHCVAIGSSIAVSNPAAFRHVLFKQD